LFKTTSNHSEFFLSESGDPIKESNMSGYFAYMFKSCTGCDNVTPHAIRHLFATRVVDSNPGQVKTAAKFMAHSVATLESVYADASERGQILLPSIS
jgi:integrase